MPRRIRRLRTEIAADTQRFPKLSPKTNPLSCLYWLKGLVALQNIIVYPGGSWLTYGNH